MNVCGSLRGRNPRRMHCNNPIRRSRSFRAAPDPDLDVTALQLKLSDVLLDQKLDQFFKFFLVHAFAAGKCLTNSAGFLLSGYRFRS